MASDLDIADGRADGSHGELNGLEEILAEYVDRLNAGERIHPEEVLFDHPQRGHEIVEQLDAFVNADRSADPHAPGKPLGVLGDFTLRRQIGRGGMGVVYDAWQNSMRRRVALKVLPAGLAADDRAFDRFMREARAAGRLTHRNVVPVHAMGQDANTPYYAMEYVEGETLEQLLTRLRPSDEMSRPTARVLRATARLFGESHETTARGDLESGGASSVPHAAAERGGAELVYYVRLAEAFAGAAEGLQHAHSHGVIHRDVKPSNLILDRDGELRVLDFGLAHLEGEESLTQSGRLVGTVIYMSPEQAHARARKVDHRTDIYSLGATMYEMLTWRPPFKGTSHFDTLSRITEQEPMDPRKLVPRIPRDLETIVLKCLRKDPADRYGTTEALAQDLRRFARGAPIEARPQSRWERLSRRAWKHRGRIAALVSLGLLVVVATLWARSAAGDWRQRAFRQYETHVREAAMRIQRASFRHSLDAASMDVLDPRITAAFKYLFPDLFTAGGFAPPVDLVRSLERAADLVPTRPEAHYYRARVLLALDRLDEARKALDRALEVQADFAPARYLRDELLALTRGEPTGVGATPTAAEGVLRGWERDWIDARRAVDRASWDGAALAFDRLFQRHKAGEDPYLGMEIESLVGRGKARLGAKDYDGAIEDFVLARARWPDELEPHILLAKAYFLQGNRRRGDVTLTALEKDERLMGDAAVLIGGMYLSLGDFPKSLEWVRRIRDPALRACAQSEVLRNMGYSEKAEAEAKRAVALAPGLPWSHSALGWSYLGRGRFAEAGGAFAESIRRSEEFVPGYQGLGCTLARQERWEDAIEKLQEAIRRDRDFMEAYEDLGRVHLARGRPEDARAVLLEALRLQPNYAYLHTALGYVEMELGNYDDAVRRHERALELNPAGATPHYHLSFVYERRGEIPQAIRAFTRAVELQPFQGGMGSFLRRLLGHEEISTCREELQGLVRAEEAQLDALGDHPMRGEIVELIGIAKKRLSPDPLEGRP